MSTWVEYGMTYNNAMLASTYRVSYRHPPKD